MEINQKDNQALADKLLAIRQIACDANLLPNEQVIFVPNNMPLKTGNDYITFGIESLNIKGLQRKFSNPISRATLEIESKAIESKADAIDSGMQEEITMILEFDVLVNYIAYGSEKLDKFRKDPYSAMVELLAAYMNVRTADYLSSYGINLTNQDFGFENITKLADNQSFICNLLSRLRFACKGQFASQVDYFSRVEKIQANFQVH